MGKGKCYILRTKYFYFCNFNIFLEELFDNIYYPGLGNYINFYLSLTRYLEGNLCFWKLFNKNDNILKIYIYYDGH